MSMNLADAIKAGNFSKTLEALNDGQDVDRISLPWNSYGFTNGRPNIPLILAMNSNQHEIVELLIMRGANINAGDSAGYTPLRHATENTPLRTLKLLLENKADPNFVDVHNNFSTSTALHYEVSFGDIEKVRLLLVHGADLTLRNSAGQTALALAQALGPDRREIAMLLEAHQAKSQPSKEEKPFSPKS